MTTSSSHVTGPRVTRLFLGTALAVALAACGGGVADGSRPETPVPTGSAVIAPAPGSAGLAATPPVRANARTAGAQTLRAIGATSDGGFVVAWLDSADPGAPAVHLQRYDASGARVGAELVTPIVDASATALAVAALPGGDLVLSWVRSGPASQAEPWIVRTAVVVQRYDAATLQPQPERELAAIEQNRIDAATMRYVAQPTVVRWDDGRFVVGWAAVEEDASGKLPQVYTQAFDAAGRPVGTPVQVGTGARDTGYRLDAAPGGGLLVTTSTRVMGRTVQQVAGRDGAVAPVLPAGAPGIAEGSLLLPLYGGRSALVSPAGSGASVQLFGTDGQPLGTASSLERMPVALAPLRDGGWLALGATGAASLQAVRFDAAAQHLGAPFEVATPGAVPQGVPLAGGGLGLAWTTGGDADVMAQALVP